MWSAVYKSRFHLEWFACVWVGGRVYDRLCVCTVPGWTGQGWDLWVCVHKNELARTAVAFNFRVNGNAMLCVRWMERKVRMSAGPEAVLRFCSSMEVFVISEKTFQTHFLSLTKGTASLVLPNSKSRFWTFFLQWLVMDKLVIRTAELQRKYNREVLRKRDFCIRDGSGLLSASKMGTHRLDQIRRPPKFTLWLQTLLTTASSQCFSVSKPDPFCLVEANCELHPSEGAISVWVDRNPWALC